MAWESGGGGGGDTKEIQTRLTMFLGPYEPLIMNIQSLLVWERPWKSAILFAIVNLLFWFLYFSNVRFFFIISIVLIFVVFIDTWKNKIWPEIRVPPKDLDEKDEWTPVHPRLLSVPEISNLLSDTYRSTCSTFFCVRGYRSSYPLVFCLGNTALFTVTAVVGCHISGFALIYLSTMLMMLWPSLMYHSVPSKVYKKIEPGFQWLGGKVKDRFQFVFDLSDKYMPKFIPQASVPVVEEEFVPQDNSEVSAALSKAIADSEDDNGNSSSIATPGISNSPSFNNSEEDSLDQLEGDFELEVNQMPSFDDLDHTDDELDLPGRDPDAVAAHSILSNLSRLSALQFTSGHFGESDSEDDRTVSENLDFGNVNFSNNAAPSQSALQSLGGAFVARTISSMMESALQGVTSLGQGQTASSSSVIPRTGAKITYTCSEEGESIDFQNPHATILESEGEISDDEQNKHIAEIEKEFDFLVDLE